MGLNDVFNRFLPQIEAELQEIVRIPHHDLGRYYGMMQYHLGWASETLEPVYSKSGKRLRPILCLLVCEAAGGDPENALPAAVAVELIHNFSLVHDDIQDVSHFRRGRRAVWDLWGVAHGINVGDGLFVLARLALHRLARRGVSLARRQAATLALDQATLALCEGQFFDMTFEDRLDVDMDQYLWMIRHKTAALLAASARLGALIATDDQKVIGHYSRFAENLGMAFQIQDDVLGVWGDETLTGKSVAIDIRDRKKALPAVYTLTQTDDRTAAQQLAALYAQDGALSEADIQSALFILERVNARRYAEEMAEAYYRQAIENLEQTGLQSAAQSHLHEIAASLLGRET
jgi:geranylgeranyl diphosphate synthase type I